MFVKQSALGGFDPWGGVFAAIGASAPAVRMQKPEVIESTLVSLRAAAAEIERQLSVNPIHHPGGDAPSRSRATRSSVQKSRARASISS